MDVVSTIANEDSYCLHLELVRGLADNLTLEETNTAAACYYPMDVCEESLPQSSPLTVPGPPTFPSEDKRWQPGNNIILC